MGCDIHLHVEVRRRCSSRWTNAGFTGQFSSRIYGMFAILADVRSNGFSNAIASNRGIPDDSGFWVNDHYYKNVQPKKESDRDPYDWEYSRSDVKSWCKSGYSKLKVLGRVLCCSDPDAHSESWCTAPEMRQAFETTFRGKDGSLKGDYIDYLGLVSMMEALDNKDFECRAVFWFDN